MTTMKVVTFVLKGRSELSSCITTVLDFSMWFEVSPLPDEQYALTVKDEIIKTLWNANRIMRNAEQTTSEREW